MAVAMDEIEGAARVLRAHGATEVYLFGSRSVGENDEDSDVDLAVRGLPDKVFFEAYAKAALSLSRELDLISLDDVNPFTEHLGKEGRLVRIL